MEMDDQITLDSQLVSQGVLCYCHHFVLHVDQVEQYISKLKKMATFLPKVNPNELQTMHFNLGSGRWNSTKSQHHPALCLYMCSYWPVEMLQGPVRKGTDRKPLPSAVTPLTERAGGQIGPTLNCRR